MIEPPTWFVRLDLFIRFMLAAARAYCKAGVADSIAYADVSKMGIPFTTLIVARGREAWRVSQIAINAYKFPTKEDL